MNKDNKNRDEEFQFIRKISFLNLKIIKNFEIVF